MDTHIHVIMGTSKQWEILFFVLFFWDQQKDIISHVVGLMCLGQHLFPRSTAIHFCVGDMIQSMFENWKVCKSEGRVTFETEQIIIIKNNGGKTFGDLFPPYTPF